MVLRPFGHGNMDDYIKFLEDTLKGGTVDLKGALFFTKEEFYLDNKKTIKVLKEYMKRHNIDKIKF